MQAKMLQILKIKSVTPYNLLLQIFKDKSVTKISTNVTLFSNKKNCNKYNNQPKTN